MKKIYYLLIILLTGSYSFAAVYNSPGTGVTWTLSDLVANSGGIVTFNGTEYLFNDSVNIRTTDVLRIETDAVVKFNPQVVFKINGTIIIDPPTGVLFTPVSTAAPFRGVWLEFSTGSIIKKLTFEYASSFRLSDSSPLFDGCIFRFNNNSTTLASGAMSLFRSNPILTNCQFLNNYRSALNGGANIANAPVIVGCTFSGNNTLNGNVPHINLGASGADTTKIIGCNIINPGGIRTGGISFLPLGVVHVLINSNNISGNRYGINLQGGADINAMVSYNYIANNNIEGNSNLGGSGIAFSGGSASSHQNTIVTGNTFENNLWGITIYARTGNPTVPISGALPNLGNLNNADTSDDGKNRFINNTNTTTPGIDLYNNSTDPIFAMGNYWNTNIEAEVEGKIFHQPDDATLGPVIYSSFILPVELLSFNATRQNSDVKLQWKTAQEANSHHFDIEKSYDGLHFNLVASKTAAGNSNTILTYNYTDANVAGGTVYYRLKLVDIDGSYSYSAVVAITFPAEATKLLRYYPNIINPAVPLVTEFISDKVQKINLQYFDAAGHLLANEYRMLTTGFNKIILTIPATAKGALTIKLNSTGFSNSIRLIVQ